MRSTLENLSADLKPFINGIKKFIALKKEIDVTDPSDFSRAETTVMGLDDFEDATTE